MPNINISSYITAVFGGDAYKGDDIKKAGKTKWLIP